MKPRPNDHAHGALVRGVLRAEKGLRGYVPTSRYGAEAPKPPPGADEVIAALLAMFPPGSCIGLRQVVEVIGITWERARAVRDWARHPAVDAWPWLQPSPMRPPTIRRKGGGSC